MRINEIKNNDEDIRILFEKNFSTVGKIEIKNGLISCNNTVNFLGSMEQLPVNFEKITGSFNICYKYLKTLKGCPNQISGNFFADGNKLKSLVGGPEYVETFYDVSRNPIVSLKGCPKNCQRFKIQYHSNLELLKLMLIENLIKIEIIIPKLDSIHIISHKLNDILLDDRFNKQQKVLEAKRYLISAGYESNARL